VGELTRSFGGHLNLVYIAECTVPLTGEVVDAAWVSSSSTNDA